MASNIKFTDNSIEVTEHINKGLRKSLREVAAEIVRQAKINSRVSTGETRKKYSYRTQETVNGFVAYIGSNYKNAIWEEFGTGEYALKGGRKTPWYVPVERVSGKKKPTFQGKVVVVYGKDGQAFYKTDGKKPSRALFRAFEENKDKYIARLQKAVDE